MARPSPNIGAPSVVSDAARTRIMVENMNLIWACMVVKCAGGSMLGCWPPTCAAFIALEN